MDLVVNEEEAAWVRELFLQGGPRGCQRILAGRDAEQQGTAHPRRGKIPIEQHTPHYSSRGGIQVTSLRKMPVRNISRNYRSSTKRHLKKPMTLSVDAVQRQRKTDESPTPARTQRCWRALSTAPTAERRCLVLCTQTDISWRTAASAKKSSLSITAFQRGQRNKGGRDCDGQALYLAERVDAVVLKIVEEVFRANRDTPYSQVAENRIRQESNLQKDKTCSRGEKR